MTANEGRMRQGEKERKGEAEGRRGRKIETWGVVVVEWQQQHVKSKAIEMVK